MTFPIMTACIPITARWRISRRCCDAAHARGLKVILDEVLAHTSDEHAWFADSRDGDAAKADWYVWADPKDDGTVPNNWLSVFGGPAWAYQPARRQYYHHKFLRQQPKLNWRNRGAREAALAVLDLWLERGVDGFRLDVANAFLHDAALTDNPPSRRPSAARCEWSARRQHAAPLPRLQPGGEPRGAGCDPPHGSRRFDDRFVFGEFSEEFERSGCYLPPDKGLHAGYNFALLVAERLPPASSATICETLARYPDHWPSIAFSNHDVIAHRHAASAATRRIRPRQTDAGAAAVACAARCCSIRARNWACRKWICARDQLRDPVGDLYYPLFKGRDGCRTPMPWDARQPNLGFTTGTPWLPLGPAHAALAVSAQEGDPDSHAGLCPRHAEGAQDMPALSRRRSDLAGCAGCRARLRRERRRAHPLRLQSRARARDRGLDLAGATRTALDFGTGERRAGGRR